MDPLTIALLIMMIASVVTTVTTTVIQAEAAEEAGKAQEKAYERKAKTELQQAGARAARLRRLRKIKLRRMGEAVGQSGFRADLGTPLDAIIDTSAQMQMDEINVARGGLYSFESNRAAGANARYAGDVKSLGYALEGTASVLQTGAMALSQFKSPGGGGESPAVELPAAHFENIA